MVAAPEAVGRSRAIGFIVGAQPGGEGLATSVATVGNILSYTDSTASFGFTYYDKVSG